jgi:excisionase family DNA binding protein
VGLSVPHVNLLTLEGQLTLWWAPPIRALDWVMNPFSQPTEGLRHRAACGRALYSVLQKPADWYGAKGAARSPTMSNTIAFRDRVSCTVEEACSATGLGRTTLYKLIKERRIAARKVGRRTVVLVATLLAEIEPETKPVRQD